MPDALLTHPSGSTTCADHTCDECGAACRSLVNTTAHHGQARVAGDPRLQRTFECGAIDVLVRVNMGRQHDRVETHLIEWCPTIPDHQRIVFA